MAHENPRGVAVEDWGRSALCARIRTHLAFIDVLIKARGKLTDGDLAIARKAKRHLEAALREVQPRPWYKRPGRRIFKTDVVAAISNMREAEVECTMLLRGEALRSRIPQILMQAREHLPPEHPQRVHLEKKWSQVKWWQRLLPVEMKGVAAETQHEANRAEEAEQGRLRSFVQILLWSIAIMSLIAVCLGLWATFDADVANLFCFQEEDISLTQHCPLGAYPADGSDVFLIEFMGMFAAALAGAVSLSTMRGNSSPYEVSVLLLLLRLPVGAMAAVLGILLVSGAFFPGLTSLDSSAQIIAWAAAFGILQEPVTRAVDRAGRTILGELSPAEGEKAPPKPALPGREQEAGARSKGRTRR